MANNRMFLVYRPTGDAVFLGKRMSWGWYGTPNDIVERIALLFEKAAEAAAKDGFSQDDFAVALEIGKNHPFVISEWKYNKTKDKGIVSLAIDASVRYGKPEEI